MNNENSINQEKVVSSDSSLESEINSARINALELKLETLSIITESLWNILGKNSEISQGDLQGEMANVISARAIRDQEKVTCQGCGSVERASKAICSHCGENLVYNGKTSPFDY